MPPVLTVGSVAFDSIETPYGEVSRVVGGAATYFSVAASFFTDVQIVAVVGEDFGKEQLEVFTGRRIDLSGLQKVPGGTFRWKGKYSSNLNERDTIYTKLNVFEDFSPSVPEVFRESPFVFLANIHPSLQFEVLKQVTNPSFVALDTMNYWIEGTPDALKKVLKHVHVLIINDSEAQELSGCSNLVRAARTIQKLGPKRVVIKRGEYGVLMTRDEGFFAVPAMPLERVCDPTGAGDTFAGGFIGYLAAANKISDEVITQAIVAGSTMASFAVEDFGLDRLLRLTKEEIHERFTEFKHLTFFDPL